MYSYLPAHGPVYALPLATNNTTSVALVKMKSTANALLAGSLALYVSSAATAAGAGVGAVEDAGVGASASGRVGGREHVHAASVMEMGGGQSRRSGDPRMASNTHRSCPHMWASCMGAYRSGRDGGLTL